MSTLKEYIGEQTLASLIRLINSKFKKYVKKDTLDERLAEVPAVDSAEVGQTIVVKSVDDTGKPTEWEAADFPEVGDSGTEWEVLQQVNVPDDAEEVDNFVITFPEGYSSYLLIANLEAPSADSTLVIYPYMTYMNGDLEESGLLTFWDYYPGTSKARISMYFEQMKIDETMYYRVHGAYSSTTLGKPVYHQDSGWLSTDKSGNQFIRWYRVKVVRKIPPLSNYVLLGRVN